MSATFDVETLKKLKRIAKEARPEPAEITRKQYEKILEETEAVDMTNGAENVFGFYATPLNSLRFKVKD